MRKIFIDGGAYNGKTSRDFAKLNPDFEIFAFEPDPENLKIIKLPPQATLIKKAIWNIDGILPFQSGIGEGSNLLFICKSKTNTSVETINFVKWLKENFTKEDYIIIKLDIEGAEYCILKDLLESGLADELYVEWHNVPTFSKIEDSRIKTWNHNVAELNKG
jgi:FkbM family methyltransferase